LEEEMSYTTEEKEMWLEDWKQSGKGAWTYAKENGLVPQTFVGWTKRGIKGKQSFIEIPKQALQRPRHIQEILIEKGDMRIYIPLEPVLKELHTVISRLGQVL
jgi:hypothetical protein